MEITLQSLGSFSKPPVFRLFSPEISQTSSRSGAKPRNPHDSGFFRLMQGISGIF
jgi:hypothetical protein